MEPVSLIGNNYETRQINTNIQMSSAQKVCYKGRCDGGMYQDRINTSRESIAGAMPVLQRLAFKLTNGAQANV